MHPFEQWRTRTCLLAVALLCGLDVACHAAHTSADAPGDAPPVGRGPAIPLAAPASASATPAPNTQVPFLFPTGPDGRVCVYDRPRQDVFVYNGTARHLENLVEVNPGQYYYDDGRNVYVLDAWREQQIKLVDGDEVGGFAFSAAFDGNYHLYFLGQTDPGLAARGIGLAYLKNEAGASPSLDPTTYATSSGAPSVTVPPPVDFVAPVAKPRFLTKINALAVLHGGVTSINVDGNNDAVVFTTADGGLYLYTPPHPQVFALLPDELIDGHFHAAGANIDPVWGRYVVWQDTARNALMALDRWTGHYDTMPYAALYPDAVSASVPNFYEADPYDVFFIVTLKDGDTRVAMYNLLTEHLQDLVILNAFTHMTPVAVRLGG